MRLLLLLSEPSRLSCADYFESRGCDVDTAVDLAHAQRFLRFRAYDGLVLDLADAGDPDGCEELLQRARKRNRMVRAAILTTGLATLADDGAAVLTKPLPLATVYDAVIMRTPAAEHPGAALHP